VDILLFKYDTYFDSSYFLYFDYVML